MESGKLMVTGILSRITLTGIHMDHLYGSTNHRESQVQVEQAYQVQAWYWYWPHLLQKCFSQQQPPSQLLASPSSCGGWGWPSTGPGQPCSQQCHLKLLLESFLKTNQNFVRFCSFLDILTKTNQTRMHSFQFSKRTD